MKDFAYLMPTKLYFGKDCVLKNSDLFKSFGKKALIVTGHSSAKKNGSQNDIISVLEKNNIDYCIFDEIEENPMFDTVVRAGKTAVKEKADFVIGIGGGSPMDSAKAIAFLAANPDEKSEFLFEKGEAKHLPVIEIPTTAGTGSEVTQYAILTVPEKKTKVGISKRTFAEAAFLDAKYFESLPVRTTRNTAVDALTHLIESYLCTEHSLMSDMTAEKGMEIFKDCKEALIKGEFSYETREKLLTASTLAGISIAQSQTSLPHSMGYYLTYFKHLPHGPANAQFTKAYMDFVPEQDRVAKILSILNFKNTSELDLFLRELVERVSCTDEEINEYADRMMNIPAKLATVSKKISKAEMVELFRKSVKD